MPDMESLRERVWLMFVTGSSWQRDYRNARAKEGGP